MQSGCSFETHYYRWLDIIESEVTVGTVAWTIDSTVAQNARGGSFDDDINITVQP